MLRSLPPLLMLIAPLMCSADLGAEEQAAVRIAAALIHQRAEEQAATGHGALAGQLDALANGLSGGQVSLADAALVMQIALAGGAPPAPARATRGPGMTPAQVTALLDSDVTTGGLPPEPAVAPARPPTVSTAPASLAVPAEAAPPAAPAPAPAPAPALGNQVTTVLASLPGQTGKPGLVMIAAGEDKHLAKGQRLQVRRAGEQIALLSITEVRDTMSICVSLPTKDSADVKIKEGDAVFAAE